MARTLSAAGFTTVCCTPHMLKGSFEKSADEIRRRVAKLQQQLAEEAIPLQLIAASEYYLDEYLLRFLDDPLPLGETRQLLIEIPGHVPVDFVKETCYRIKCSGFIPLIAHPERCSLLKAEPRSVIDKGFWRSLFSKSLESRTSNFEPQNITLLGYLKEIGCCFQGNIGSFAGVYGERVRRQAIALLGQGVYDCFGSDAHHAAQLDDILQRGRQILNQLDPQRA